MTLRERAEKASGRWAKRVYKRDGTVPTWAEWSAWIERWVARRSHVDAENSGGVK